MTLSITENQKILKAVARIEYTNTEVPFNKVRESVAGLGVRWAKEALIGIPSATSKTRIEICLESTNASTLNLARSELEKYASVESFAILRDRPAEDFNFTKRRPGLMRR